MDELENRWNKLRLSEEEEVVLDLPFGEAEDVQRKGERSLIGRICLDRVVGKEIVSHSMGKIWRISQRAEFQEVAKNTFVLTFATHADKDRILEGRPWLFDNGLFALRQYDSTVQPSQITFESEVFWVQFHNLALGQMTRDYGLLIGQSVGRVIEVDTAEDGVGWGKFLRVKLEVSLHKPIARGRFVNSYGRKLWVQFQYEKLPRICFKCGCLSHVDVACQQEGSGVEIEGETAMQFGAWLRAEHGFKRRSLVASSYDSAGGKQAHTAAAHREEGSMGSTDAGERLPVPEENLAQNMEEGGSYDNSEIRGSNSNFHDKIDTVKNSIVRVQTSEEQQESRKLVATSTELQDPTEPAGEDFQINPVTEKGGIGGVVGWDGPVGHSGMLVGPGYENEASMHSLEQNVTLLATCTHSALRQPAVPTTEAAELSISAKGTHKWKRRARSKGQSASCLDNLSGQKRLVDENDEVLAKLVVSKKGKGDAYLLKVLAEAGSQPRQLL
ncbi:uncharacterized protein LOC122304969 [Carya illinoinensis]|uniref:uncharacterized protein LOC122304969 n=1 Tax=Carya illinoinensis TaxID=32201 RepID=UPI001C721FA4|nr:uncharacterized protein LOC122304969 [Carya illinoinensis]